MSRYVTYNGVTKFDPGGITKINANKAAVVGISATGVVGLIGEADDGAPNTPIIIDDPAEIREKLRSGPLADAAVVAFDPSADPRIPGGASQVICYKVNQSEQATLDLPGSQALIADTAAGVPTTSVIQLTTNTTMVADTHVGRWLRLPTLNEKRRIVSNTTDTITVSPAFTEAPAASDAVQILESQLILTSRSYGIHANQISVEFEAGLGTGKYVVTVSKEGVTEQSPEILGDAKLRLVYRGGPVTASGEVSNIAEDGLSFELDVSVAPALDDWAGMLVRFANGVQREISGNTAADPSVVTLISGHGLSAEDIADLDGQTAEIINVTSATASIAGANGRATTLTSAVLPTADDLNLTFKANETLRQFVDRVNANTNYEAQIPAGVNPDTTLMADFDFGTAATAVNVRFDEEIDPSTNGLFKQDLKSLVDWFNNFSEFVTAERASAGDQEGSELPSTTGGASANKLDSVLYLYGGSRGISTNSNWQTAFDEMMKVRMNHLVPLISQDLVNEGNGSTATLASVAAQAVAHAQRARGEGQNEQGLYMGIAGSLDAIVAQAQVLNDTDIQLSSQKVTRLGVEGSLKELDEWAFAVTAAGMRSGAPEVGEPLTHKKFKATAITNHNSWDPKDKGDRRRLIENGIMFAEEHPNGGYRIVRDITTHLMDDKIFFIAGSTRDTVRFIAYDLRTDLENEFTGEKAKVATANGIKSRVVAKMEAYKRENMIVDSNDPERPEDTTTIIPGYRRIKVSLNGNTARVKVEIFPVTGIVFQLSEISLQIPRITV